MLIISGVNSPRSSNAMAPCGSFETSTLVVVLSINACCHCACERQVHKHPSLSLYSRQGTFLKDYQEQVHPVPTLQNSVRHPPPRFLKLVYKHMPSSRLGLSPACFGHWRQRCPQRSAALDNVLSAQTYQKDRNVMNWNDLSSMFQTWIKTKGEANRQHKSDPLLPLCPPFSSYFE